MKKILKEFAKGFLSGFVGVRDFIHENLGEHAHSIGKVSFLFAVIIPISAAILWCIVIIATIFH